MTSEIFEMQNFASFRLPDDISAPPKADHKRQAVQALRGYAYQIWVTALAWIRLQPSQRIYLEVAEDYALIANQSRIANQSLKAVQVKQSATSAKVTLNRREVKDAIISFIDLQKRNPDHDVYLRFYTTMPIGLERNASTSFDGMKGLKYWHKAASGSRDVTPIRKYLESERCPDSINASLQCSGFFCGFLLPPIFSGGSQKGLFSRSFFTCQRPLFFGVSP